MFNDLVMDWNKSLNLVSRRKSDVYDLIEENKLFFKYIDFRKGLRILDLGTGGGFPGILLAIHHPEIMLTLVDSVKKKVKAVKEIIASLGLVNAEAVCSRAEDLGSVYYGMYNYVVARSVAPLDKLIRWSHKLAVKGGKLVTIKGGDISKELLLCQKLRFVSKITVFDSAEKKSVVVDLI